MSIPVIDTLNPLGSFPVAKSKDIDCDGTALNTVLSGKANTSSVTAKADKSYVDAETAKKVDKVSGKGLSTNDYDNTEKAKVTAFSGMFSIVD